MSASDPLADFPVSPEVGPVFTAGLNSPKPFPVDFETARLWLKPREKRNAVTALKLLDKARTEWACTRVTPPQGGAARDLYSTTVGLYMKYAERAQTPTVYARLVELWTAHREPLSYPPPVTFLPRAAHAAHGIDRQQSPGPITNPDNDHAEVLCSRKRRREGAEFEADMAAHRALMVDMATALAKRRADLEIERISAQIRITGMVKEALGEAYTERDRITAELRVRAAIAGAAVDGDDAS